MVNFDCTIDEAISLINNEPVFIFVLSDGIGLVSACYIFGTISKMEIAIGFGHTDLSVNNIYSVFSNRLNDSHIRYVYNLKDIFCIIPSEIRNTFSDFCVFDWYVNGGKNLSDYKNCEWQLHNIYKRYPKTLYKSAFSHIVPIIKISKNFFKQNLQLFEKSFVNISHLSYSNYIFSAFNTLYTNGICLDEKLVYKLFGMRLSESVVHPYVNMLTLTGRPGFMYNNINFNALPKNSEHRNIIVSRYGDRGALVNFDYNAYHVYLIAKIIGYELPDSDIHTYFGKMYFGVNELTEEQYNQSKSITFGQVYGGGNPMYSYIPFFKAVKEYTSRLYSEFINVGYVETLCRRKIIYSKDVQWNPDKLFAHVMQSHETEKNALTILEINKYLYTKKSKLCLYTYDSFLIDVEIEELNDISNDVLGIVQRDGFMAKRTVGHNYGEMIEI